jgi:hypothetical protein
VNQVVVDVKLRPGLTISVVGPSADTVLAELKKVVEEAPSILRTGRSRPEEVAR